LLTNFFKIITLQTGSLIKQLKGTKMYRYLLGLSLALMSSCSLFGGDQTSEESYYAVKDFSEQCQALYVPKNYFDRVCQNGKEKKWVFGLNESLTIVGLEFTLLEGSVYKPGKNGEIVKVYPMSRYQGGKKFPCKQEKDALLKYIEEHGEEEYKKMLSEK
jgi:hypothetical protein